jgi:hypothetical protein
LEPGAKLSRILDYVFEGAKFLRLILIPSSVTTILGLAFICSAIESIYIQEGNLHIQVLGEFLLDFGGRSLIRYFGSDSSVCVPRQIEILCAHCFEGWGAINKLSFESESSVRKFGAGVSFWRGSLLQIMIPVRVRKFEGSAFMHSRIRSIGVASDSRRFRTDGVSLWKAKGVISRK